MVRKRDVVTRPNVTTTLTLTLTMIVVRRFTTRKDTRKDVRNPATLIDPKGLAERRSIINGTTLIKVAPALNVRRDATWYVTTTARRSAQRNKSGDGKKRRSTQAKLALQNHTLTK